MRLSLDQLEAERGEVDPFEVDLGGGQVVTLPHPKDMPFESLVNFDQTQPAAVLRALMGDDTFKVFSANPRVTLGILEQVLTAYYKHFGLGGPGESDASLHSVKGSAGPSKSTSRRKVSA